jgi:RNA polymerase sigma-32 factor
MAMPKTPEICPVREMPDLAGPQPVTCCLSKAEGGASLNLAARVLRAENLAEDEERRCLTEYQTHHDLRQRHKALDRLLMAYGKLVVSAAAKYHRPPQMSADLVSAGFLGLLDAINDFDLTREGVRLGTYAGFRIRHEMQTFLRRNSQPVCLPDTTPHRQLMRHSRRLFEDAERACKREKTTPHQTELCRRVAARVGLSVYEVEKTIQLLRGNHVALDDDPYASLALPSLFTASHEDAVVSAIDSANVKHRVLVLADEILGTSECLVFLARCMSNGDPERLETLADRLGVSSERIYQLPPVSEKLPPG